MCHHLGKPACGMRIAWRSVRTIRKPSSPHSTKPAASTSSPCGATPAQALARAGMPVASSMPACHMQHTCAAALAGKQRAHCDASGAGRAGARPVHQSSVTEIIVCKTSSRSKSGKSQTRCSICDATHRLACPARLRHVHEGLTAASHTASPPARPNSCKWMLLLLPLGGGGRRRRRQGAATQNRRPLLLGPP